MELLEYYDSNNEKKLGVKERSLIHSENLWHREIAVWILNEKNEVLIQKRSSLKKLAPNMYATCAGHVDVNESEEDATIRELFEETGIKINKNELELIKIYVSNYEGNKHFKYMYFVRIDKKIEDMVMQENEVSELKYITLDELEDVIKNKDKNYTFSKQKYAKEILSFLKRKANISD